MNYQSQSGTYHQGQYVKILSKIIPSTEKNYNEVKSACDHFDYNYSNSMGHIKINAIKIAGDVKILNHYDLMQSLGFSMLQEIKTNVLINHDSAYEEEQPYGKFTIAANVDLNNLLQIECFTKQYSYKLSEDFKSRSSSQCTSKNTSRRSSISSRTNDEITLINTNDDHKVNLDSFENDEVDNEALSNKTSLTKSLSFEEKDIDNIFSSHSEDQSKVKEKDDVCVDNLSNNQDVVSSSLENRKKFNLLMIKELLLKVSKAYAAWNTIKPIEPQVNRNCFSMPSNNSMKNPEMKPLSLSANTIFLANHIASKESTLCNLNDLEKVKKNIITLLYLLESATKLTESVYEKTGSEDDSINLLNKMEEKMMIISLKTAKIMHILNKYNLTFNQSNN